MQNFKANKPLQFHLSPLSPIRPDFFFLFALWPKHHTHFRIVVVNFRRGKAFAKWMLSIFKRNRVPTEIRSKLLSYLFECTPFRNSNTAMKMGISTKCLAVDFFRMAVTFIDSINFLLSSQSHWHNKHHFHSHLLSRTFTPIHLLSNTEPSAQTIRCEFSALMIC